jgi:ATP-dependent Clp protease ATP-binding subunit ClpA
VLLAVMVKRPTGVRFNSTHILLRPRSYVSLQALSRGDLQVIGATTIDEHRKYIEKDAALERRFQPVMVDEPTELEAVDILMGLRDRYESYHRCRITDEAVQAAVKLSSRYSLLLTHIFVHV